MSTKQGRLGNRIRDGLGKGFVDIAGATEVLVMVLQTAVTVTCSQELSLEKRDLRLIDDKHHR